MIKWQGIKRARGQHLTAYTQELEPPAPRTLLQLKGEDSLLGERTRYVMISCQRQHGDWLAEFAPHPMWVLQGDIGVFQGTLEECARELRPLKVDFNAVSGAPSVEQVLDGLVGSHLRLVDPGVRIVVKVVDSVLRAEKIDSQQWSIQLALNNAGIEDGL